MKEFKDEIFFNDLKKNGFVIIRNVFSKAMIKKLQKPLKLNSFKKNVAVVDQSEGFNVKDNFEDFLKFLGEKKNSEEIIKNTKRVFESTSFFKSKLTFFKIIEWNALRVNVPENKYKNVYWHQDIQTPLESKNELYKKKFYTFWIPFTAVNKENSIEILPNSNKKIVFHNHYRVDFPLPKIYQKIKPYKIKINAGDMVVLDNFTFHKSILNISKLLRISVDLRYSNSLNCNFKIHYKLKKRMLMNDIKKIFKKVLY